MHQHVVRGRTSLCHLQLTALMARLNMQRPLLVCGKRMQQFFAERVGLALPCFSGYHPNPDLSDCAAGAVMYCAMGCDGLISLGGGSAMDTAKGVKAMLVCADEDAVKRSDLPAQCVLPHIAIPGTAGTGAEATPIAVVYVNNEKLSLDHPALLPEGVLLDGSLLDTLPDYHKKACAMDALAQGIESYWAVKATAESRVHAARAIRGVVCNMTAYLTGDPAAQDAMLEAAYESGCAIRISRTTAAHAMSYQLTKRLGYAHGHACMLTLPHLWAQLRESGEGAVLKELAQLLGLPAGADGSALLLGLLAALDMDAKALPEDAVLDALAASVNAQRLGNHPQPLTTAQLRDTYVRALTPMERDTREAALSLWRQYGG
ncbi:MAG: iron-containing alcohol dehydrogenase [Clostridia bacterium]|nr:iron-containing alcohol dehydrogenase [Clostridia bacterium]